MGLFDAITGLFDGGISTGFTDFGSSLLGGLDSGGGYSPLQVSYPVAQFPSYPQESPQVYQVASPPMVRTPSKQLFQRYPNLFAFVQKLGGTSAVGGLLSMLSKWGPTALAGFVGSQVVAELISYKTTHKRRRMNPGNTRALRRSLRRLKSFERLSHRVSMQLSHTASRGRGRRVTRCGTCRKNPCSC